MTSRRPDTLVIGAGVSGLTTAICLAEAGHDVTLAAAQLPPQTTSAAAGAIWGPHLVGMDERVTRWGSETLARLTELAADPSSGVHLAEGVAASARQGSDPFDWVSAIDAARPCDPAVGNDVVASADADEWTVIYRFDSKPHLVSWLASPEREAVLGRGADLFDGPASQHVLVRDDDANLVTVVVSHPVDPADEDSFLAWQGRVTDAERTFAGFRGAELFRPVPGVQDEWTALYRHDTDEHLNAWLESAERRRLLEEGRRFKDFRLHRISSPFGSWFAQPAGDEEGGGPALWKTALSVLVGLYPTVVLLTLAISALWKKSDLWASLLVGNILSVSLLTWVVMPIVTRALRFWLAPEGGCGNARVDALGALASVAFLTVAAALFWACTTQIWHLP